MKRRTLSCHSAGSASDAGTFRRSGFVRATRRALPLRASPAWRAWSFVLLAAVGAAIARAQESGPDGQAPAAADAVAELENRAKAATGEARAAAFAGLAAAYEAGARWSDAASAWRESAAAKASPEAATREAMCLLAFAEEVLAAGEPGAAVRGAFEDARAALTRALLAGARDVALRIGIARCHAADGRTDDQLAELGAAADEFPSDPAPKRALAFALYHAGRDAEAIPAFRTLSDAAPDDPALSLTLSECARRAGDETLAIAMADRAIGSRPADRRGWSALWSVFAPGKRWRELAAIYAERLRERGTNSLGWHYHGFALASGQQWKEAVAALGKAFELDPNNTAARLEQVRILLTQLRDRDLAATYAREILAIEPSNRQAASLLSYVAQRRSEDGDHAGSIRELEVLCAATPGDPVALSNLAVELKFSGSYTEAEKAYRRALAVSPGDPQVLNDLGLALMGAGRLDEARALLLEGHAADPAALDCVENLGWLARHQGRTAESSAWYAKARELARERGSTDARFDRNLDDLAFPLPPPGTRR